MPCSVGPRHSWEKCGLDVQRGRLVRVRVCSYCQQRRLVAYKTEEQ